MMFPIGYKRRCARRNPKLAAMLGLFSTGMMGAAAFVQRYQGKHETLVIAGLVCVLLVGLVVIRFAALDRDDDR